MCLAVYLASTENYTILLPGLCFGRKVLPAGENIRVHAFWGIVFRKAKSSLPRQLFVRADPLASGLMSRSRYQAWSGFRGALRYIGSALQAFRKGQQNNPMFACVDEERNPDYE